MMKGVLVYISGPISPKNGRLIEDNVVAGLEMLLDLTKRGIPAFSPQIQAIYPSAHMVPYATWMEYDFAVIDFCTHMLMLYGWQKSTGACQEKEYADDKGIPVAYNIEELEIILNARGSKE